MAGSVRKLLLLAVLLTATAARSAVTVLLRQEVLLDHSLIVLGDLATVDAEDEGLRRALEQIVVGKAPLVGYVDQRSRADLEMIMRGQALAAGQAIIWHGAERIRLRTESQRVDAGVLLDVARQQLLAAYETEYDRLDVTLATPLRELTAPAGKLEFQARLADAPRLKPRMAVWVDVLVQGTVYRSAVVPLAVRAYRQAYVAQGDLAAGDIAGARAFVLRPVEVAGLPDQPLAAGELDAQRRLRRAVARGEVLAARNLTPAGSVMRGDRVRLVSQGGGIALEVRAYAQADAAVGQKIPVRPESSSETVTAIVVSSDVVRIDGR